MGCGGGSEDNGEGMKYGNGRDNMAAGSFMVLIRSDVSRVLNVLGSQHWGDLDC
jgi:hypothetical protein